jgi:hypothetical protein
MEENYQEDFLTANSLYVLASIGSNKETIPFIPMPEINIDEALVELSKVNYKDNELSKSGRRKIVAISMIQRYKMCAIINDIAYFYNSDEIQCVAVVTRKENEVVKYALIIGNKFVMLMKKLYENKWLHDNLTKSQVINKQYISVTDMIKLNEEKENFYVTLFINGEIKNNSIYFNNNGSTIKYDVINKMIEEKKGREFLKELFKNLTIGEEYEAKNSYQMNQGI